MQSNVSFERTERPRTQRPPVEFKQREQQAERRKHGGPNWERNDNKRRQSDMMN